MQRRRGFTLIEILVVVGILVLLTAIVVAAFRGNEAQKVRDAGRSAQSSILGSRDRALHAKALRGFRISRDPSDSNLGNGFVYVQKLDFIEYGPNAISLERVDLVDNGTGNPPADGLADNPDIVIVRGIPGTDWYALASFFPSNPRIRIPANTGAWYTFQVLTTGPYALTAGNPVLQLTTPFIDPGMPSPAVVAHTTASANATCEIDVGNEMLPMHQPISLPSGVVIDLNNSSPVARGDIMFSPRGSVTGPIVAGGPIYIMLRDVRDVTEGINPANVAAGVEHRDNLIVAINPQTGHCAVFPVDQTDSDANGTADDLFRFARLGSASAN